MKRVNGWENILSDQIRAAQAKTFKWGTFDCSLWTCDVVFALTGVDLAADFRGKYSTSRAAKEVIKQFAGADLEALAVKRGAEFGMEEIDPQLASRGDVVLVRSGRKGLGIVALDGMCAHCASFRGLARVPRSMWLRAWRV
ncbi:MAG: DUF6950 family protein [Terriglobales bacterium]